MKRWLALLLVIAAFCAMAMGSGHRRPLDTSEPDVSALKPKPLPASAGESEQAPEAVPAGPAFAETVLYDREGVTLTATGLTYDGAVPAVGFLVENGSSRKIRAACAGLDVNGYWFGAPTELICAPESRTYGKLTVDPDGLAVCGITEIAQLDLDFELSDAKTGSILPDAQSVRILTDAARERVYTADKTGRVLYYAGGVEITVKGRDGSTDPVLCIGNTLDGPVRVELTGFAVNGFPLETALVRTLPKDKVALAVVRVPRDELAGQKITPEQYTLRFEIRDETTGDLLAAPEVRIDCADLRPLP